MDEAYAQKIDLWKSGKGLHPNCKLTADQVIAVRESRAKPTRLAKRFNVSYVTIYRIKRGYTYADTTQ